MRDILRSILDDEEKRIADLGEEATPELRLYKLTKGLSELLTRLVNERGGNCSDLIEEDYREIRRLLPDYFKHLVDMELYEMKPIHYHLPVSYHICYYTDNSIRVDIHGVEALGYVIIGTLDNIIPGLGKVDPFYDVPCETENPVLVRIYINSPYVANGAYVERHEVLDNMEKLSNSDYSKFFKYNYAIRGFRGLDEYVLTIVHP